MRVFLVLIAGFALFSTQAEAGSSASAEARFTAAEAADFAKQIEEDLAAQGARLAIVFRAGRPREDLPDGIDYTHGAFWVHQPIQTEDGRTLYGYASYNLYHGQEDRSRSYLAQDWPFDFTSGDQAGEVGVIIPSPEMQRRLINLIVSPDYEALHNPVYSVISNPHDLRFQNCTEFLLDVIAAAAWETSDHEQIKANLEAHFRPTRIRVGFFERLFGPSMDDRVRIEDHGSRIYTATFQSLADFMLEHGLAAAVYELEADHLTQEVEEVSEA